MGLQGPWIGKSEGVRKLEIRVSHLVKGLNTRLRQNHGKIYISYNTKIGFKQQLGLHDFSGFLHRISSTIIQKKL